MNSLILRTTIWLMMPVLLLFSVFLLLRGHDEPGGGFIGGLVAATAILLHMVAYGPEQLRALMPIDMARLLPIGLLLAVLAGLPALFGGYPFLKGIWYTLPVMGEIKVGTPILFDLGVYLAVIGVTFEMIMGVAEEEAWKPL